MESPRTLEQRVRIDPATGAETRVSTVVVVVRGQLEYNEPTLGFRRFEGTTEFILRVEEPVR